MKDYPKIKTMSLLKLYNLFAIIGLMCSTTISANEKPIPVNANENTTVSLFFPSPIAKVIKPAPHFTFEFDTAGTLATIRAKKGNSSNVTVITQNGAIFSFVLKYSQAVANFTYIISETQAVGKKGTITTSQTEIFHNQDAVEQAQIEVSKPKTQSTVTEEIIEDQLYADSSSNQINNVVKESDSQPLSFYDEDREGYYQIFCENSYLQRDLGQSYVSSNSGLDIRLNHFNADQNELYFTLQFRNVSKSDYLIKHVQFYIQTLGSEEIPMEPLYTYNLKTLVKQSEVNKFVYVFKDFTLGPNQKVYATISEEKGIRHLVLPLDVTALKSQLK